MRAKTVNENYPPGAANDPRAPWNEPEDDSIYSLDVEDGEIVITRKYNQWAEDEWDEDKGYIDPEEFDLFAAKKLGINAEEKWDADEYLEIENVEDISKKKYAEDRFRFETSWGTFEADMDELIDMTNLF